MALARLTSDSIASDSRPTEPVSHQASVFSAMVSTATPIDTRSQVCGGTVLARWARVMARLMARDCRAPGRLGGGQPLVVAPRFRGE